MPHKVATSRPARPIRHSGRMDAQRQAALAVGASLDPDKVISAIARQACTLMHCQHSAVYLFDAEANVLQLVTGCHLPAALVGTTTIPGQGPAGQAFRRRRAIVTNNAATQSQIAAVSLVTHGKRLGTGLGMAVAKANVEANGGTISFTTETDRGTTFTIRLPSVD